MNSDLIFSAGYLCLQTRASECNHFLLELLRFSPDPLGLGVCGGACQPGGEARPAGATLAAVRAAVTLGWGGDETTPAPRAAAPLSLTGLSQ